MAWQALEDIASAHKLPHPWNRQHERSLTGATAQPQAGSAPGHPAAIPARARARLDGRERQRGRQAVDRAARAAGRALGELLGGLGRQLLALRLRLHAQPARALLAQHAQPITSSPSMNSSSGWLKLTRLAACACGVGLG